MGKDYFSQGNELLEENKFGEAREFFRKALEEGAPSKKYLFNLSVAENQEILEFRRNLRNKHSQSLICQIDFANHLGQNGYYSQALGVFQELVNKTKTNLKQNIEVRLSRINICLKVKQFRVFQEDFIYIWKASNQVPGASLFRPRLVKMVASLNELQALDIVLSLGKEPSFPDGLKSFLEKKGEELGKLNEILNSL